MCLRTSNLMEQHGVCYDTFLIKWAKYTNNFFYQDINIRNTLIILTVPPLTPKPVSTSSLPTWSCQSCRLGLASPLVSGGGSRGCWCCRWYPEPRARCLLMARLCLGSGLQVNRSTPFRTRRLAWNYRVRDLKYSLSKKKKKKERNAIVAQPKLL